MQQPFNQIHQSKVDLSEGCLLVFLQYLYADDVTMTSLTPEELGELLEFSEKFQLDRLTHLCRVKLEPSNHQVVPPGSLRSDLKGAINSAETFPDITFVCEGDRRIVAHKVREVPLQTFSCVCIVVSHAGYLVQSLFVL